MVRDRADPDVAVFLQVLGGDHCWGKGLSEAGQGTEGLSLHPSTHLVTPRVLPVPPIISPHPHTFAKRDAVQVAALEEAGLDGAGLWEEQPLLSPCPMGCHDPIPIVPRCPLAHHLGDRVHPVVALHQLILRWHPVLPFPHSCGRSKAGAQSLREHPGVM